MDAGKRTPLHTHPIAESLWILDGQLRYHIAGDEFELGAGDFVIVPGGVPHAFLVLGFDRLGQSAQLNGGIEILGPPPF